MDKCFHLLQVCQLYRESRCLWCKQESNPGTIGEKITLATINHVRIIKLFSKWDFWDASSFVLCQVMSFHIILPVPYFPFLSLKRDCSEGLLYCPEISAMINTLPWIVHHIFPLGHQVQCPFIHLSILTNRFSYTVFTQGHTFRWLPSECIIRVDCSI